jgi:hypothetical protein
MRLRRIAASRAMSGESYRGRQAAFRALRQAIAEAMTGAGRHGTPVALELMLWADEMEQSNALHGWVARGEGTTFSFMLSRRQ